MQACKLYAQSSLPTPLRKSLEESCTPWLEEVLKGAQTASSPDEEKTEEQVSFFGKNILFEIVPQEIDSPPKFKA